MKATLMSCFPFLGQWHCIILESSVHIIFCPVVPLHFFSVVAFPFSSTSGGRSLLSIINRNGKVSCYKSAKIFHFRNGLGK